MKGKKKTRDFSLLNLQRYLRMFAFKGIQDEKKGKKEKRLLNKILFSCLDNKFCFPLSDNLRI